MPEYRHFIENYVKALENLNESSISAVLQLCSPRIEFRDPFHHIYSSQAYGRVLQRMFRSIRQVRFEVLGIEGHDRSWMLTWRFTGRNRWVGHLDIPGMSEIECDEHGLVKRHIDYWDSGEHVYRQMPIIGAILRLMAKRDRN